MNKQNGVYPCNRILFSDKKELITDTCKIRDFPKKCAKWEIQKSKYCVDSTYMKILWEEKSIQAESSQRISTGDGKDDCILAWSNFLGDGNVLKQWCQWNNCINLLKFIKLYIYNGWILWYISYISIKLLAK